MGGEEKNDSNQERASSISEARVKPRKLESKISGENRPREAAFLPGHSGISVTNSTPSYIHLNQSWSLGVALLPVPALILFHFVFQIIAKAIILKPKSSPVTLPGSWDKPQICMVHREAMRASLCQPLPPHFLSIAFSLPKLPPHRPPLCS